MMKNTPSSLEILSPAKINLFLHVTGKRPDGYHDLISLMCRIGLYDKISIVFGAQKTTVSCNNAKIPPDETNLAYKAASLFLNTLNKNEKINIFIEKNIPVAAGLGGGSSNAASVFLGLNQHYGLPFTKNELMALGLQLGADVPFFIFQKPAIATGVGEKLDAYLGLEPFHLLVVYPGFSVSTADVYKNLNLQLTKCKKKIKQSKLRSYNFDAKRDMCNDLEIVTASKHPDIDLIKGELLENGALGALMSGSGPSTFGIFTDEKKAREAEERLSKNKNRQVFLTHLIT
ncbi:MAG: 4-(cytidine 5'-diphospho)-2-C-methyl-D-erythritol kinase [Desulfobacterales bacterium]|nr:4-(cytidine 5'-diphospho)-2-C-methyl-D-erythritol kinase [Desulfobacterales bacterium]